jgi:hypothetical protein
LIEMKSFLNFFSEARQTKASTRAKQLGLTGDGQGNWVDKAGNIVARTEGGELRFTDRKAGAERQETGKTAQYKTPEQQPQKRTAQPEVEGGKRQGGEDEGEGTEGGDKTGQTLTLVFGRFNPPTTGHKKLLDASAQVAGDGDLRIYPSRSFDPKKNPLENVPRS